MCGEVDLTTDTRVSALPGMFADSIEQGRPDALTAVRANSDYLCSNGLPLEVMESRETGDGLAVFIPGEEGVGRRTQLEGVRQKHPAGGPLGVTRRPDDDAHAGRTWSAVKASRAAAISGRSFRQA
jgi:hypothetical protein